MPTEIEVLIADDHPVVREGLRRAIENTHGMKVVAEAGDGQEALVCLRQLRPHVAVLDIDMPLMDGFAVAQRLREETLGIKVIFMTVYRGESFLNKALDVGAQGYISKESPLEDVITAIKTVVTGQQYLSPAIASRLFSHRPKPETRGITNLTPTERSILRLVAEYRTTKDISAELSISSRTVETHRANICKKLALQGSHALIKFAIAHQEEL